MTKIQINNGPIIEVPNGYSAAQIHDVVDHYTSSAAPVVPDDQADIASAFQDENPLLRAVGVAGRGVVKGITSTIDAPIEVAKYVAKQLGVSTADPEDAKYSMLNSIAPTVEKAIDKASYDTLKPKTEIDKYLDTAGNFIGGTGVFNRFGPEGLQATGKAVPSILSAAAGVQGANDAGLGPLGQLLAAAAGGHITATGMERLANFGKNVYSELKTPAESAIIDQRGQSYDDNSANTSVSSLPSDSGGPSDSGPSGGGPSGPSMVMPDNAADNSSATGNIPSLPDQQIAQPQVKSRTPIKDLLDDYMDHQTAQESLDRIGTLQRAGLKNIPLAVATTSEPMFALATNRAATLQGAQAAKSTISDLTTQLSKLDSDFINNLSSSAKNTTDDVNVFQTAAKSIKNNLIDARKTAARANYGEIADKVVTPDAMKELLGQSPIITSEIKQIQSNPVMQSAFRNVKPNSVGFLDTVKQNLDGKISAAQRAGSNFEAAQLMKEKSNLVNTVENEFPAYKTARYAFSQDSEVIDSIFGKKQNSPLNSIIKYADYEPTKVINQVFSLQPDQIARMRSNFQRLGQGSAFDSLTRAFLTNKMANAGNNASLASLIKNPITLSRLNAALGSPEKTKALSDLLDAHDIINSAKGIDPRAGSRTFKELDIDNNINEASQNRLGKAIGAVGKVTSKIKGIAELDTDELQKFTKNPEYNTQLIKTLFNPEEGENYLKEYLSNNPEVKGQALSKIVANTIRKMKLQNFTPNPVIKNQNEGNV